MLLNILCSIDVDDKKQQINPYFIQMTLNVFFCFCFCFLYHFVSLRTQLWRSVMILFVCLFLLRRNVSVNFFSVMSGRCHCILGISGSKLSCSRTQHGGGRFRTLIFRSGATALPQSVIRLSQISKVYFELNTRAIGWSAEECASIALCIITRIH